MWDLNFSNIEEILLIFFLLLVIILIAAFRGKKFAGGKGTEDEPYLLKTAIHLNNIRKFPDAHFRQEADITLAGYKHGKGWNPIGNIDERFRGAYNGNGFQIRNLIIDRPDQDRVGLFCYIEGATLKNIKLRDVRISGKLHAGALAGETKNTVIMNCSARGNVAGANNVSGLIGTNNGNISNCYAGGNISGVSLIGGLVGSNIKGEITNSYAEGKVSGEKWFVGGLAGEKRGSVTNCYSRGIVSGGGCRIGGLVGYNIGSVTNSYAQCEVKGANNVGGLVGSNHSSIRNCYGTGKVRGNYFIGGLVGGNEGGVITNCYARAPVTGEGMIGGLVGAKADGIINNSYYDQEIAGLVNIADDNDRSAREMKCRETYRNWDFEKIWNIREGQAYPFLQWQSEYTGTEK